MENDFSVVHTSNFLLINILRGTVHIFMLLNTALNFCSRKSINRLGLGLITKLYQSAIAA